MLKKTIRATLGPVTIIRPEDAKAALEKKAKEEEAKNDNETKPDSSDQVLQPK